MRPLRRLVGQVAGVALVALVVELLLFDAAVIEALGIAAIAAALFLAVVGAIELARRRTDAR